VKEWKKRFTWGRNRTREEKRRIIRHPFNWGVRRPAASTRDHLCLRGARNGHHEKKEPMPPGRRIITRTPFHIVSEKLRKRRKFLTLSVGKKKGLSNGSVMKERHSPGNNARGMKGKKWIGRSRSKKKSRILKGAKYRVKKHKHLKDRKSSSRLRFGQSKGLKEGTQKQKSKTFSLQTRRTLVEKI